MEAAKKQRQRQSDRSSRGRGRAVIKFRESPKPADTVICIIPRIITRWALHIIHKPYSGNRLTPRGKAHKFQESPTLMEDTYKCRALRMLQRSKACTLIYKERFIISFILLISKTKEPEVQGIYVMLYKRSA